MCPSMAIGEKGDELGESVSRFLECVRLAVKGVLSVRVWLGGMVG